MKTANDDLLARKWGCQPSTIWRWRCLGAPLDRDAKMTNWLWSRKGLPAATKRILENQLGVELSALMAAL